MVATSQVDKYVEPAPFINVAVTTRTPMDPHVVRHSDAGLVVTLRVGRSLALAFTGPGPDKEAPAAIDNLIDALQALRRLVIAAVGDEDIIAAASERVLA